MELPEPFHSAKMSSWPSLMRDPQVSLYTKAAARAFLAGHKMRLRLYSAPMETPAFLFRARANAPEG
jgi:hypothetical protein